MDTPLRHLAEPRRAQILRLTWDRELAAGEIARSFPDVTRPAIAQHVSAMRRDGLLLERREGRRRLYCANRLKVAEARAYLDGFWTSSLERLKDLAEAQAREENR